MNEKYPFYTVNSKTNFSTIWYNTKHANCTHMLEFSQWSLPNMHMRSGVVMKHKKDQKSKKPRPTQVCDVINSNLIMPNMGNITGKGVENIEKEDSDTCTWPEGGRRGRYKAVAGGSYNRQATEQWGYGGAGQAGGARGKGQRRGEGERSKRKNSLTYKS